MITRRNILRGVGGAFIALPFLETFAPKRAQAAEGNVPKYGIFLRQGNGVQQATEDEPERYWPDQGFGALTTASMSSDPERALARLAPFASKLTIPRGLNFAFNGNGCGHSGGGNQVLTAASVSADPSGAESLATGESIDNLIARKLGAEGATEPLALYAGRKFNYLDEVMSYRAGYELRAAERNPYNVYIDLFGLSNEDPEVLERLRNRRQSVNDLVRDEMDALRSRTDLSKKDRDRLDQHFTAIRDLEEQLICGFGASKILELEAIQEALDDDSRFSDVCRLHMDLLVLTMSCGARRAATLQLGSGNDGTTYTIEGVVQKSFHKISHRIDSDGDEGPPIPDADILHHKIDVLHVENFRYLLEQLDAVELEQGTLLDYGVTVMTNDLSNKYHSYDGVPFILAGGALGALRTGIYAEVEGPHNKLFNSIGAALGVTSDDGEPLHDFGDASLEGGQIDSIMG